MPILCKSYMALSHFVILTKEGMYFWSCMRLKAYTLFYILET